MKPHAFHPGADAEYADAALRYAGIDPELGRRFYEDVEATIRQIRRYPAHFRRIAPEIRRALCRRFPYAVVFTEEPDRILILAVMHGRRRPEYWRPRLA